MTELGDLELLRAYADRRSEEAFGVLVRQHLDWVYSTALRRVRDPHLAQEVVQTVFVILARKAPALGPATLLTGWLYRTTSFACTAALRTEHRRHVREQQAMDHPSSPDTTWAEVEPHLERAVSELREKDRCAVLLHYYERKNFREIGAALGVSEDAAQKRVSRALERLRGLLGKAIPMASVGVIGQLLTQNAVQAAPAGLLPSVTSAVVASVAPTATFTTTLTTTLKLMAWTKTKTALAGALALLFVTLGTVGIVHLFSINTPKVEMAGAWEGTLDVGEASLRLVAKLRKEGNGSYSAVLDSIDQGVRDIPVNEVKVKGRDVQIELKALNAVFNGKVSEDQQEWSGVWTQLGRTHVLTLKRTDHPTGLASVPEEKLVPGGKGSELQGYWKGALSIGATKLRLVFKIADAGAGKWTATLDSLDQGVRNVPVTGVTFHKPVVELEVTGVGGFYEGKLNAEGTEIAGQWTQGGKHLDLVLERGEPEKDLVAQGSVVAEKETDLQGEWEGVLNVKSTKLRLALRIAKLPDGQFAAALDSLDQGAKGIPASRINYQAPELRLEWAALSASFQAKLEGGVLSGNWQQGPMKLPLDFNRKKP